MSTHNQVPRYLTVLVIILTVAFGLLGLVDQYSTIFNLSLKVTTYISIFIVAFSVPVFYSIRLLEKLMEKVDKLKLVYELAPTDTYGDQDQFFAALLKESIDSTEVYTHMLSDAPNVLGQEAETYFENVHRKLKRDKNGFRKFRRIATVHSEEKAAWILKTLLALRDINSFSLAIQYIEDNYPQTSFHVTAGNTVNSVFVWVAMGPGGYGKAFIVKENKIAEIMIDEHQREFLKSVLIKEGSSMYWQNIEALASKYKLERSEDYTKLLATKHHV